MPHTNDPGKMYDPRISAPHSGTRGHGGYFYGPSNNPIKDIIELEYLKEEWMKQKPTKHMGLTEDKIKKHKDRVIKKIDQLKKKLSPEQTQQYHDTLIEIQQEEERLRRSAERPRIPYGPIQVAMAEEIPEAHSPYLRHRAQAYGRYAVNAPTIEPDIAESSIFNLQSFLESTLDKVRKSTNNNFDVVSQLFKDAVEQTLDEGKASNLSLLREIFAIIREKTGDNYAGFRTNFSEDILRRLESENIGRGLAMTHGEQLRRRMEKQKELYPDSVPRLGGMILDQSKKHHNRFKVSETGYGVEVDNLITLVSKKTLLELMKGMDESTPVSRLRKMSKGDVANYFMETFATGPIDRRKAKVRPVTKLGTPLDNAAKYAESRQNSLEMKKKRPRPVRTGISL